MDILMMLILPIHEHGTCFHLFVSSLISFFSLCSFLSTGPLPPWLGLFPGLYFPCCYIEWDIFPISVSDIPLLVYKNAADFWILTLYPAVLPSSLIRSSFLVESIEFSMYTIISSANSDSFASSFPIWMPFLFFFSFIYYFFVLLLWLGLLVLCWIVVVKAGIFVFS